MNQERIDEHLSYPQRLALLKSPKTPVHLSLQHIKFLYLFDLVSLCLQPGIPSEVKQAAEELILAQLPRMAVGQKITLARRGPAKTVSNLLVGENLQIIQAALDNPYMTEAILLQCLNRVACTQRVVESIASHKKWSTRYDLRLALLRHPQLPMAQALKFIPEIKIPDLKELAQSSQMNPAIRRYLQNKISAET